MYSLSGKVWESPVATMFFLCGCGHLSSSILRLSRCQRLCRSTSPRIVLLIPYVLDFWIIAVFVCKLETRIYISYAVKFGHFLAGGDDWAEGTDGAVSARCCKFRPPKVDTLAIKVSISDANLNRKNVLEGAKIWNHDRQLWNLR